MNIRIGKVTNIYPNKGKVKVLYEDTGNTSLQLPVMTFNDEYSMPSVGDRVLTLHMENGSSKGFVLGTFYSDCKKPKVSSGYRKDLDGGSYISCNKNGAITIHSEENITFSCSAGSITLSEIINHIKS